MILECWFEIRLISASGLDSAVREEQDADGLNSRVQEEASINADQVHSADIDPTFRHH